MMKVLFGLPLRQATEMVFSILEMAGLTPAPKKALKAAYLLPQRYHSDGRQGEAGCGVSNQRCFNEAAGPLPTSPASALNGRNEGACLPSGK